jgi:ribosomal peptide maturation radical SAM protein 1
VTVTTAPANRAERAVDVCLVSMPYASLTRPSMALGLLAAILERDGIVTTVAPAGLWFAERAGLGLYELCASRMSTVFLAGEWTFAAAAFGDDAERARLDAEYLRQISEASLRHPAVWRGARGPELVAQLVALRAAATRFTEEAARRVLATGARVVGCTSTFEQHVASLALLRRIRELDPGVVTMLGGANCETVMGQTTHRCFPWVDFVVSGEADGLITRLCRLALDGRGDADPAELPPGVLGPAHRRAGAGAGRLGPAGAGPAGPGRAPWPRAVFSDLDSLPTPRYDDYFAALAASPLRARIRPGLPLETSRGCWWGAVHQCTFCGLNGTGMGFRSKSPGRVAAEFGELQDRYGIGDFEAVDNILDHRYYSSLLPDLAADGRPRRIFFEIKANVTRAQVEALVAAGVTWVQPGIESLHSEVLRLMDKGIKGWQNVQLLKWARELGLRLSWSLLWGFPGEKDDWYEDMAAWLPALEHLQPPASLPRVRFDRYSVYHEQARRLGLILFPIGAMSLVYPLPPAEVDGLAYFFSTEPGAGPLRYVQTLTQEMAQNAGIHAMAGAVRAWRAAYGGGRPPVLVMDDHGDHLKLTDTRGCATQPSHLLAGLAREVYLACDAAPRRSRLAGILPGARQEHLAAVTAQLIADRLVIDIDGRLIALALPISGPVSGPMSGPASGPASGATATPDHTQFPGGHVYAAASRPDAESR